MSANILERLLITLAVRLHAFAVCEIASGWRLAFDAMNAVTIHYVLRGTGTVAIGTGAVVDFAPGCIVIVPAGVPQTLGAAARVVGTANATDDCKVVGDGLVRFVAGYGAPDMLVVCGTISASYGGALGLFEHLREPLVEDCSCSNLIGHAFSTLLDELARPGIGSQVLTEALMKQCLVLVLRQNLARGGGVSPVFAPLADARLAGAIAAILERPAAPHSVESLAAIVGLSRSAFADRFTAVYGQAPLEFVKRVRLRLGAQLLSTTDLPIKVITASVGYTSRSYFSRAFRTLYGSDPTTYRAVGGYAEAEPEAVRDLQEQPGFRLRETERGGSG